MPQGDPRFLVGWLHAGHPRASGDTQPRAEAEAAVAAGADYLGVGPCFPSATKAFAQHAPREFLAAAAALPVPVFAIGGIDGERIDELVGLGLTRIAVAAAVTSAAEPAMAVRALLAALDR